MRTALFCALLVLAVASPAWPGENGLLAHWRMDEIVGGVVPDATGLGHDAKVGGDQPELVPGVIGKALKFSADRQMFLTVANPRDFTFEKGITVMAWIKPLERGKAYEILCNKGDKSGNPPWPGWRFRYAWTRVQFQYGTADGKQPTASSPEWSTPAGFWSHAAATFDGQTIRMYVNAVEQGSAPGEGKLMLPTGMPVGRRLPLIIGNYIGRKNAYAFDGLLDDLRIHDHALGEDAIFAAAVSGMP